MIDKIEAFKEKAKTRRDLMIQVAKFKREVDGLLHKDFFHTLLKTYDVIKGWKGVPEWFNLYGVYLEDLENQDDCLDCASGKMALIEKLIFHFEESNILTVIDQLYEAKQKYLKIKEMSSVE